ncbi:protein-glutamate O-methylesterase CheB [Bacillaceae bacterium]
MLPIRVLVVDDSAFMRKVIGDMLNGEADIQVIGTARDGREAIWKIETLAPDVVTLDVEMPKLDGLQTLKLLQERAGEKQPQVIMLSSLTGEGAAITIEALAHGAFDFVQKPSGPVSLDIAKVKEELLAKVRLAARSGRAGLAKGKGRPAVQPLAAKDAGPAAKHPDGREAIHPSGRQVRLGGRPAGRNDLKLVAVGTSTGGPRALEVLLRMIPGNTDAAFLIVQHMPAGFTKSLAQRLDRLCELTVVEARDGQRIENGTAYIAPGGYHMEVREAADGGLAIALHQQAPRGGHRPAVDVLYESLVPYARRYDTYCVIMTGMGKDGTEGLKRLKGAGLKWAIAEAPETCVVFGMPRAAVQSGCIDEVQPLPNIAEALLERLNV